MALWRCCAAAATAAKPHASDLRRCNSFATATTLLTCADARGGGYPLAKEKARRRGGGLCLVRRVQNV